MDTDSRVSGWSPFGLCILPGEAPLAPPSGLATCSWPAHRSREGWGKSPPGLGSVRAGNKWPPQVTPNSCNSVWNHLVVTGSLKIYCKQNVLNRYVSCKNKHPKCARSVGASDLYTRIWHVTYLPCWSIMCTKSAEVPLTDIDCSLKLFSGEFGRTVNLANQP